MAPSIKTIAQIWPDKAKEIRGIMDGSIDPESFENVERWVRQCYNRPSTVELQLEAINGVLEGHGVEALDESSDWFPQPHYSYVNMGDTYTTTVVYDHERGRWLITDWGTIAEKFPQEM